PQDRRARGAGRTRAAEEHLPAHDRQPAARMSTAFERRLADADSAVRELRTVRDLLRWATSRFTAAGLAYGHGTGNAWDEAVALLLWSLHLPPEPLDPWLDARLPRAERRAAVDLFERRIDSRLPAAYLTGEAWLRGMSF